MLPNSPDLNRYARRPVRPRIQLVLYAITYRNQLIRQPAECITYRSQLESVRTNALTPFRLTLTDEL